MFDAPPRGRDAGRDGTAPDPAHLDAFAASWAPIVGRDRRPIGVRLTLRSATPAVPPPPTAQLLDGVLAGFGGVKANLFSHGLVLLAPVDFPVDATLAQWTPPRNVLLEIAASDLEDPARLQLLVGAQRRGVKMALRVDGPAPLAREKMGLFQYIVGSPATPVPAGTSLLVVGLDSSRAVEDAFAAGAHAAIGWPLLVTARAGSLEPTQTSVLTLIRMVQADDDIADLERVFKTEPVLAYMLLTLANSPAFMRPQPIASLSQAIVALGYARLVKWLVLLLVIASKSAGMLPAIYAAVARAFFMEQLALQTGASRTAQDECFVVGVFSLLDVVTQVPADSLFAQLPLPPAVLGALRNGDGDYAPLLAAARAVEGLGATAAPLGDELARRGLTVAAANAALLRALAATDAMQGMI